MTTVVVPAPSPTTPLPVSFSFSLEPSRPRPHSPRARAPRLPVPPHPVVDIADGGWTAHIGWSWLRGELLRLGACQRYPGNVRAGGKGCQRRVLGPGDAKVADAAQLRPRRGEEAAEDVAYQVTQEAGHGCLAATVAASLWLGGEHARVIHTCHKQITVFGMDGTLAL
ncbi:hypothetical protein VTK26DRAFT_3457 [Humicola hyalothermophila]